ncbi:cobalt-precorrin-6A reductase [Nitrospirillum iridis]|uniref:Precorrin-6A/cobalt-precorrin-6A reductase n=1 Tax=Nitrospirillum iridis TaxID=765888 RepID=A0A7X0EEE8_9PROT|nr:cobalt-precorrin-6A reductase [Nitrospirillum iridis]MBB6253798.1 precorrin-6A/cobalt-precorrin-6A reductase [Nitrospirillum iridis]
MRVLVLGGTTEARELAGLLAADGRFQATLSLAGRTRDPAAQPLPTRVGGFGGVPGLVDHLHAEGIQAVIDATHPFASQISAHAEAACAATGIPLAVLTRRPWTAGAGDNWRLVADMDTAATALAGLPDTVFLTVGRQELEPFLDLDRRFLVRAVDPPDALPAGAVLVLDRGPYTLAGEMELMRAHGICTLVTKNSGGDATAAKLAAARALKLPVVMVDRPPAGSAPRLYTAPEAIAWLATHGASASAAKGA